MSDIISFGDAAAGVVRYASVYLTAADGNEKILVTENPLESDPDSEEIDLSEEVTEGFANLNSEDSDIPRKDDSLLMAGGELEIDIEEVQAQMYMEALPYRDMGGGKNISTMIDNLFGGGRGRQNAFDIVIQRVHGGSFEELGTTSGLAGGARESIADGDISEKSYSISGQSDDDDMDESSDSDIYIAALIKQQLEDGEDIIIPDGDDGFSDGVGTQAYKHSGDSDDESDDDYSDNERDMREPLRSPHRNIYGAGLGVDPATSSRPDGTIPVQFGALSGGIVRTAPPTTGLFPFVINTR